MKLWLIEPNEDRPCKGTRGVDPWKPCYDKCFGMVIRAESEDEARQIASGSTGDENRDYGERPSGSTSPWIDGQLSTCVELTGDGKPGVIMSNVASA